LFNFEKNCFNLVVSIVVVVSNINVVNIVVVVIVVIIIVVVITVDIVGNIGSKRNSPYGKVEECEGRNSIFARTFHLKS
jgi:hypothetical protein